MMDPPVPPSQADGYCGKQASAGRGFLDRQLPVAAADEAWFIGGSAVVGEAAVRRFDDGAHTGAH